MQLQTLIDQCVDTITAAIYDDLNNSIMDDVLSSTATVNLPSGSIDIWINHHDEREVVITHDHGRNTEHPRLSAFLEAKLPCWREVVSDWESDNQEYDIWTRNGFASEADYIRYRYG